MKAVFRLCLMFVASAAFARLGETEAEMVTRFGKAQSKADHKVAAQGKMWTVGSSLSFKQDDWLIQCDVVDGRCARISYGKRGEWTEEQLQLVLAYNSQGAKWNETTKVGGKSRRTWTRSDGASAEWMSITGIKMVAPAYERAKQVLEAKAKADASKKPKI
jgi:hypothetical protein